MRQRAIALFSWLESGKGLAVAGVALVLLWSGSRAVTLRAYQDPRKPTVPSAYYVYHGIAVALEHGRVGQLDLARYQDYVRRGDVLAEYSTPTTGSQPDFVDYYSLDVGYALFVELGRLLFPLLPDNYQRVLALQLVVDLSCVGLVFLAFSGWSVPLGVAAAFAYAGNAVFVRLVTVPLYYFWDVPISVTLLGILVVALDDPRRARYLLVAGVLLGVAVWVRASWWPLGALYLLACATSRTLRSRLLPTLIIFALLAAPQVWRASEARGQLSLSTRATWHVALVGLGYYPNIHGFEMTDEYVFELIRGKYGVVKRTEDYGAHDLAAREEFREVLRKDPGFVVRSFVGRLWHSAWGTTPTSATAYPGLPNPLQRLLCALGLVVMHRRGGSRRLVAWVAAAFFAAYVTLTSFFYFVGLSYDGVSQVALLVLLVGLLETLARALLGAGAEGRAFR